MTEYGCPCETVCEPRDISNPPDLATIAYRAGDFASFRRALLDPRAGERALLGWHPASGDLGLQLLEWWAYLADILTFYNERIANEDYVRTAQLPGSVANLVGLLGYTPRPAIAATGRVAAIRAGSWPDEPLVIPDGFQLASTATPGVPVETFEATGATFTGASDGAIVLPPSPRLLTPPGPGEAGIGSVVLEGSISGIAAGEVLVVMARDPTSAERNWSLVTVAASAGEPDPSGAVNTRVYLASGAAVGISTRIPIAPGGAAASIAREAAEASTIAGARAAVPWIARASAADARLVRLTRSSSLWTASSDQAVVAEGTTVRIRLAAVERGLEAGGVAFLDSGGSLTALKITGTSDEFLAIPYPGATGLPPIPVLHTVLSAETPFASGLDGVTGATLRFGLRDVGTLVGSPATELDSLPVTASGGPAIPVGGSSAFLADVTGAGIPVFATPHGDETVSLAPTDETPSSFILAAPLRLLIDLVEVSRGKTVSGERLGAGDATVAGQTFTLANAPVTYLASAAGWKSTLRIAVGAMYWTEVPTFFDQPADAKVFVVSTRSDGKNEVRFGDGVNGARLPTGSDVVAAYRYGAGAVSPPSGRLTTILTPQPNLASVENPVPVSGGEDAEPSEDVRTNAPASVLTFGRAISADDYESVAALTPGVARARAYWTWDAMRQRALVKVYVGDDAGAAVAARRALAEAEDPNRPVAVARATPIGLTITCTIDVAPDWVLGDVVAAASASLERLFAPVNMRIGRALYTSEVDSALTVPGVEAVRGLSATAGGSEIFSSEPVGWADPGEGGFYALSVSTITAVVGDG